MQFTHTQQGLHSGRSAAFAARTRKQSLRLAKFIARAEGEGEKKEEKKEDKKEESKPAEKKDEKKAVAKVDRSKDLLFFASDQSLSYLDGSLPADYGFDPLGLSDPDGAGGFITPEWLRYSEVIHCRYAMLGAAGIVTPQILAYAGLIPQSPEEVTWFKTGVIPPAGTYDRGFWADPYTLFFLEVIAFQFAELRRWQDFRKPGSMAKQYFMGIESIFQGSGDPAYPGGQFFNAFNLGGKGGIKELQTKEIKNGRLAMIAVFGFGAQAVLTHKDPIANLFDHISDPLGSNILTNFGKAFGAS